jgi:hypothetical protein
MVQFLVDKQTAEIDLVDGVVVEGVVAEECPEMVALTLN